MTAALPYREGPPPRTFCDQKVELPIPEIESDGSEVTHRRCEKAAVETCGGCERPVCDEHRPADDKGCLACEEFLAHALAPIEQSLLTPEQRRMAIAKITAIIAGSWALFMILVLAGSATGLIGALGVLILLVGWGVATSVSRDLSEDKAARVQRAIARYRVLGPRRKSLPSGS